MNILVRAARVPWTDTIDILVMSSDGDNRYYGEPVIMKRPENEERHMTKMPTMSLQNDEAQFLMDELWRCGLRPTEGTGSAGSLAATEKHLADMRVIVFNRLGISEKKP